jgi:hypothetical protein
VAIVMQAVEAVPGPGGWLVRAAVDGEPTAARVAADRDGTCVFVEEGFFLLLSERGLAEVGNSAAYHVALRRLVRQAVAGGPVGVPLELGVDGLAADFEAAAGNPWWRLGMAVLLGLPGIALIADPFGFGWGSVLAGLAVVFTIPVAYLVGKANAGRVSQSHRSGSNRRDS